MTMRATGGLAVCIAAAWVVLHVLFSSVLLSHDSWIHIFPTLFSVSRDITCAGLPGWLSMVDSGAPHVIYVISTSITQVVRLPFLYAMGCMQLDPLQALYLHKIQIFFSYLLFSASMFVLGCVLYRSRKSALYLFLATLFTGLCLDSSHSDQVVSLLFWFPWIAIGALLYHRHRGTWAGILYINSAILFACIQALDQYPHFVFLAVLLALIIYVSMGRGEAVSTLLGSTKHMVPAVLIVAVTGFQLYVVKSEIADYRPSLRSELVVDPSTFGETGFAQPTALIGTIFPLSTLRAHEPIANGLGGWLAAHGVGRGVRGFMYHFDTLFFHLGIIPLILFLLALSGRDQRKNRIGWLAFCLGMLLIALQQSKLYFLIYHLPFFDVFRSYGLYLCYAVVGFLVVSGYGMDSLMTANREERLRLLRAGIGRLAFIVVCAALLLLWLLSLAQEAGRVLFSIRGYFLIDIALIAVGVWAIKKHFSAESLTLKSFAVFAGVLIGCQSLYAVGVYRILGTEVGVFAKSMGFDNMHALNDLAGPIDPNQYMRDRCELYIKCYLSLQPTASLRLDLEGSFLRSRDSVVYQKGLNAKAVAALAGIEHPVFWSSRKLRTYGDEREIIDAMNSVGENISGLLREVTYIRAGDQLRDVGDPLEPGRAMLYGLDRGQDYFRLRYSADASFFLNASITFNKNWKIRVDGIEERYARGNFDSIVVPVPAGTHTVELRYSSSRSDYFFYSRYLMLIFASIIAVWLAYSIVARDSAAPIRSND